SVHCSPIPALRPLSTDRARTRPMAKQYGRGDSSGTFPGLRLRFEHCVQPLPNRIASNMNSEHTHSPAAAFLLPCLFSALFLLSSCRTMYYGVQESFGRHKRDILK